MRIALEIGDVIVRAEAERHRLEAVDVTVQEAFRLLAARLGRTPLGRSDARARVIATLEAGTLPLDELLSPRGAERLADDWYRQLVEGLS